MCSHVPVAALLPARVGQTLAEHQASPGDVVLSNESWKMVMDNCEGRLLSSGDVKLLAVTKPIPVVGFERAEREKTPIARGLKLTENVLARACRCAPPLARWTENGTSIEARRENQAVTFVVHSLCNPLQDV